MKTKGLSIGIVFLVLMVCTTCTKDEVLLTPDGESSVLKSAPVENVVITVEPSGGDDTQAIRDAFEAAKDAGPSSIVYLTEGEFYISEPIIIEDFNGTFSGAGKDKTVVEDAPGSVFEFQSMFIFQEGENGFDFTLSITDITIQYNGDDQQNSMRSLVSICGFRWPHPSETPIVNATIQNVNFIGRGYSDEHFNYTTTLLELGYWRFPIKLNALVEMCSFNNCVFDCQLGMLKDSKVLITNNDFNEGSVVGIETSTFERSKMEVYKNDFNGSYNCMFVRQGQVLQGDVSQILIHHNNFRFVYEGILFTAGELNTEIKSNKFNCEYSQSVLDIRPGKDIIFRNNQIYGNSLFGVLAGSMYPQYESRAENLLLLGNNFDELNTDVSYKIHLTTYSKNCTVVGGENSINVLDEGIGNILTGVNSYEGPPGPIIKDALEEKLTKIIPNYDPGW